MLPIRTILHPTDFSPEAKHAFHIACSLAHDHGGRVIVLHAALPPVIGYGGALTPPPEGDWKALEQRLSEVKPPDPSVPVTHLLLEGDPVAEVLRVAQETNCDLIVLGTHGRSGLKRLLMGSVAEQIVRKAACPVLTVSTPLPEDNGPAENPGP